MICSTTCRVSDCTGAGSVASLNWPPSVPGQRALDVCCGTGDIALALAQRGADVTGLDFSPAMLEMARARSRKSEAGDQKSEVGTPSSVLRPPVFLQGDAQQLPFPDHSFDAVTIGYGLRNLSSCETGLREMRRVARPGGRLVVLDFGKPPNPLWRAIYFAHLKISVPLMGWLFAGNADAYAYILESLKHYPAQQGVAEKMRELNLSNVRVINLLGGAMAINYGEKPK
jgi:demethylmenaquinone methyltransferase / 2-methoxy-6-polyprenyl-1,4-benzoquinol methylase